MNPISMAASLVMVARLFLWVAAIAVAQTRVFAQDSVVVFNEVHYHPEGDASSLEYIELYNQLAVEIDISNWRLDGDVDYDFPEGTIIPGRGYLTIAKDPSALAAATGHSGSLGPYNRSLSNSGEPIYLYNNNRSFRSQSGGGPAGVATDELEGRRIMDVLRYQDVDPWPTGPDGSGFSLAKRDPDSGTADPANWTTSRQLNGSPGSVNPIAVLPKLAFNEASSALDSNFQIELFNHGVSAIPLGGLVIKSSDELSPEYVLPIGVLPAGSYLTLNSATLGFTPEDNDRVFLCGVGKSTLIDSIRIDNSPIARAPDGTGPWSRPTGLTLGAANDVSVEDGIVINEIFYHAKPRIATGSSIISVQQVLDYTSTWRYNLSAGGSGLGAGWAASSHAVNNIDWASGPGLLGAENSTLGEPLQTSLSLSAKISYYFESEFNYSGSESVTEMVIRHYVDDGAIFYLNGVEIGRFNMAPGTVHPTTTASVAIGNASLQTLRVPSPNILQGSNRLSVEVHQVNTGSSDVVFGANVTLVQETTTNSIPFAERDEEWIELYNRSGSSISLSGWKLGGGIDYDFPSSASIPSGGYLVIAKDASALLSKHSSAPVIGDYSGQLGNGGDLIILEDANGNVADKVRYFESGNWHQEADGGGSSLELRDPAADNEVASAWAASDESARNPWQTYTYEAVATDDGIGLNTFRELQIGLLDSGELLIDDVSVVENDSIEFIQNGDFESDATGGAADKWRAIGTHGSHGRTVVITDPADPGNQCLHVVSTGPTENKHNKLETTFANSEEVVVGNTYRISFRAKWINGSSQLNTKLYFNYLQKTHTLESAEIWGTPGTTNTAAIPNSGPDLSGLLHSPAVPDSGEAVTVSIHATDPDGIQGLTLYYSVNGGVYQSVSMVPTENRFAGTIPGQASSSVVRFYVRGSDVHGANCDFPAAASVGGAFYKVQDGYADTTGLRHNFRIIMSESDRDFLFLDTNRMSNDGLPATVIEDEETIYYDVQLRLKASAHGRYQAGGYGFNIGFQPDQLFRGVHDSISVERGGLAKQILAKTLMNRAGGGYWSFYDDVAYIIPPTDGDRGIGMLSLSRHTGSFWDGLFPDVDENGTLFNLELHYAPNGTTGGPEDLKVGNPFNHTNGQYRLEDRGGNKEAYRWGFQIRSARDRDDYSQIVALNQAVGNLSGSALKEALDPIIDVNQWMRTFAMMSLNGTDDVYGRIWEHNFRFFVRPTDGKVIVLQWDLDRAFGLATGASMIPTSNKQGTPYPVAKLFSIPEYRRIFDGHLNDLIQTTFNSDYVGPISSGLATAIGANVNLTNYITNRANYALTTLPSPVPFEITTHGGADFSEADSAVDLSGTASYDVFSIEVNGVPTPVTWSGADTWVVTVPLNLGSNTLTFSAKNNQGGEVGADTITVTNSSSVDLANASNTIISELHYHPSEPTPAEEAEGYLEDNDFEFIELMNISSTFVDLTQVNFTHGLEFLFPAGTVLAPGERIILVQNQAAFEFRYGAGNVRIVGEYGGKLSNSGERIRLAAADTTTIVDFTFSDDIPWPESSDGDGYSLVFKGSNGGGSQEWRPSTALHGNPGNSDSVQFPGGDILDYFFSTTPTSNLTNNSFFIDFTVHTAADDAAYQVQFSKDLFLWTPATEVDLRSRVDHPNGTSTLLYESPFAVEEGESQFGRVIVEIH